MSKSATTGGSRGSGILGLIFAAAVVFVGGWHGVRALVALGLTAVVILKVLIPAIVNGVPPVPLAIVVATAVTVVTILLTEGLTRTSLVAILGTTSALAITALLASAATAFLGFTYTAGSDLAFMTVPGGAGLDLRGVLLAAIILGAVGVLDDVTVTQAVLVEELAEKGDLRGPALIVSAMRIGRSHIGATVNTLFLAYVSVGLPLIIVLYVSHQPSGCGPERRDDRDRDRPDAHRQPRDHRGDPDHDLHRWAARGGPRRRRGGLGDVPVPQPIARPGHRRRDHRPARRDHGHLAGRVTPHSAHVHGPGAEPLGRARAGLSLTATPPSDQSPLRRLLRPRTTRRSCSTPGQAIPITVDGSSAGTVAVVPTRTKANGQPTGSHVSVTVHYVATGTFPLAAGQWEVLLEDGSLVPLVATDPNAMGRTLNAGERFDLQASADISATPKNLFVVYVDTKTSEMIVAIPVS